MAVRKVIQAGHPALRKKNKILTDFKSTALSKLLKDLKDTLYKTTLIGIAAPQIAQNYMVFITHPRNTKSRKLPKTDKLRIYINPKIISESKNESVIYEGCGSISEGELFGPVSRPKEIKIEAFDENGNKFSLTCDGILARVIQHEMRHLAGEEFITKVTDYERVIAGTYYRKNIRNSKAQVQNSRITKIEYN